MTTPEPEHFSRFSDRPLAGEDPTDAFVMERRWLPGPDGALTGRVACTNVAHHVVDLSSHGFDWGDSGPGSYDLALNILETALGRLGHRGPRSARQDGTCFTLALLLRGRFAAAFLAALPEEGGTLPASEVERWIAAEVRTLDPTRWALLAPRYAWEGGGDGEDWSAGELQEILGEALQERAGALYTADGRCVARVLEPHPLDGADWETIPL